MTARFFSVFLAITLAIESVPGGLQAQEPGPVKLNIVILEGEGAINNMRQRVARESIVQVEDENHKPVAGAAVVFFLPDHGASGVFANGQNSLMVTTDQTGKAVARGIRMNKTSGEMQIRVTASFQGATATAVINQKSAAVAAAAGGGAISGKLLAILIAGGAGIAVGIAVAVTRGGGTAPVPPTVITPGSPTVGAPK